MKLAPGIYKHYKGNLYEVMGVAQHSETEEMMAVYKTLYGDQPLGSSASDVYGNT